MPIVSREKVKPLEVRSLSAASAEYSKLDTRIQDLLVERKQLDLEKGTLLERLRTEAPAGRNEDFVGELISGVAPVRNRVDRKRIGEIEERCAAIGQAVKVLEDHKSVARYQASTIICDEVEAEYRRRVANICQRMIDLYEASRAFFDLADELNAKDVAWSRLYPMQPVRLFGPSGRDDNSLVAQYLREAAANRFIDKNLIPQELR